MTQAASSWALKKQDVKSGHISLRKCMHGLQDGRRKVKSCWLTNTSLMWMMLTEKDTRLLSELCCGNVANPLPSWLQLREGGRQRAGELPEKLKKKTYLFNMSLLANIINKPFYSSQQQQQFQQTMDMLKLYFS